MKLSIGLVAFAFSLLAFLVKLEARANPASSAVNSNSQLVSVQPSHPSAPKPQASLISSSEILLNNQSLNINFSDFSSFNRAYKRAKNLKLNQKDKKKFVLAVIERYRLTLASLLQNQAKMALAIMPQAENFIQAGLNPDPLLITQARAYYQNKDYEKAIEAYSQIPQSSDYWLTAREERAHTQGRLGQYEKAIADFTTLFSPVFQDSIHPEVYFTASLTYLRLCQYSKVVALLNEFKKKMKIRVSQLTELKDGKSDALAMKAVDSLKNKEYNLVSYAQWASSLPRAFHQDFIIRDQIVKFPSSQLSPKIKARLSQLAQQDLDDIKTVLTKLQLVDAEVMQRIHLAEQVKNNRRQSMGTFNAGKDQLYFPFNGEVWIDELDAYQVQSKSCPNQGGGA